VASFKSQQIRPVVIRLKPDAPLPAQADPSRNALIDDLSQKLRTVFDAIPAASPPALHVEDPRKAQSLIVASRRFVIEAHEIGPCNVALQDAIEPSVLETMKVLLGVFGMAPASITVTEQ
jgi:hypothetical protein